MIQIQAILPAGMDSMQWSAGRLVAGLADGDIQMPEIQRKYVWSGEQVRALIDSLYKGYPSGTILLWETDPMPRTRKAAASRGEAGPMRGPTYLLLDGQQRLTALAAVLTGMPVRTAGSQSGEEPVEVYFNTDHPERPPVSDTEETAGPDGGWDRGGAEHLIFQLKGKGAPGGGAWIPVTRLFKEGVAQIMAESGMVPDHPDYDKRLRRLNRLHNTRDTYLYPVQVLGRDTLYEEVVDIFVRLNDHGTRMRRADLALAQVTAAWPGAMYAFAEASRACEERGYALDEEFVVRCLVSVATGRCGLGNMGRTSVEALKGGWDGTAKGLRYAVDFLGRVARIDTASALPSAHLLVPIVCMAAKSGRRIPRPLEQEAQRWLYAAMAWGRYTGGRADAALDEDLAAVRGGGGDPFGAMLENMRPRSGRLEFRAEDIAGRTARDPLLCTMYALARRAGARDWWTGLPLGTEAGRGMRSQCGRIFPRSLIEPPLSKKHGRQKALRLSGDIANSVFASGRAPGSAERGPGEYLPEVVGRRGSGALASQCVPRDPSLWRADRYEDFLAARRAAIARAVNALVGPPDGGGDGGDGGESGAGRGARAAADAGPPPQGKR